MRPPYHCQWVWGPPHYKVIVSKSEKSKIIPGDRLRIGNPIRESCQSMTTLERREIRDQYLVNRRKARRHYLENMLVRDYIR
jgi:hypothetical protein